MISAEPRDRPTAREVLKRLRRIVTESSDGLDSVDIDSSHRSSDSDSTTDNEILAVTAATGDWRPPTVHHANLAPLKAMNSKWERRGRESRHLGLDSEQLPIPGGHVEDKEEIMSIENTDSVESSSAGPSSSFLLRKAFSVGSALPSPRELVEIIGIGGQGKAPNPKPFECDFPGCGQRFMRNSNKTTHMLTHKNERPHVCPYCQKDFTRQHDLKRHMELHDERHYWKCTGFLADGRRWGCDKEFARKDALRRHFKSQLVISLVFGLF